MSGEFREINASFMWEALEQAADETGHGEIAKALAILYKAIQPLEQSCAWHEASDSGPAEVTLACVEDGPAIKTAALALIGIIDQQRDLVRDIIRMKDRSAS